MGLRLSRFIQNAHPDARLLVAETKGGTDYSRLYLIGDRGPIKRNKVDTELRTEEQKSESKIGKKR